MPELSLAQALATTRRSGQSVRWRAIDYQLEHEARSEILARQTSRAGSSWPSLLLTSITWLGSLIGAATLLGGGRWGGVPAAVGLPVAALGCLSSLLVCAGILRSELTRRRRGIPLVPMTFHWLLVPVAATVALAAGVWRAVWPAGAVDPVVAAACLIMMALSTIGLWLQHRRRRQLSRVDQQARTARLMQDQEVAERMRGDLDATVQILLDRGPITQETAQAARELGPGRLSELDFDPHI